MFLFLEALPACWYKTWLLWSLFTVSLNCSRLIG